MSVFWTSDSHFGHANIIKYTKRLEFLPPEDVPRINDHEFRPSDKSVQQMNDALRDGINSVVGVNDTLWILGDFCFSPKGKQPEYAKHYRDGIRCRDIRFVGGNHDLPDIAPTFEKCYGPHCEKIDGCKVQVYSTVRTVIQGQKVAMSHFPLSVWCNSYAGDWHLYGHCHSTSEEWLDKIMPQRRSMDVGVDNAKRLLGKYRPFSFKEIQSYMESRVGHHAHRGEVIQERLQSHEMEV